MLLRDKPNSESNTDLMQEIKLERIVQNPSEIKDLSDKLKKINNDLDKDESLNFQSFSLFLRGLYNLMFLSS